ncbi:hypothetical protein AB0G00_24070 [Nocardia salmonicida]
MVDDLTGFWSAHSSLDDEAFRSLMIEAYPEIVTPHISIAGDVTAGWYEDLNPSSTYRAAPAALPPVEQLHASAGWAMSQKESLPLLAGSAQRMLFGGSRDTVATNAEREGTRYARHASANACKFCQILATRNDEYLYSSESTAEKSGGKKYHDHCHCIAVPVRGGSAYKPPDYVEQWSKDYDAAAKAAGTNSDIGAIMRAYPK